MMSSTPEIEDEEFEFTNQNTESPFSDFSPSEDEADRIKAQANNGGDVECLTVITKKKSRHFTAAQNLVLKKYYTTGMRGTGERCFPLIEKCKTETGLTSDQIKAS